MDKALLSKIKPIARAKSDCKYFSLLINHVDIPKNTIDATIRMYIKGDDLFKVLTHTICLLHKSVDREDQYK